MGITAIFGTGVMGEALLAGMLSGRWAPADLVLVEKDSRRAKQLQLRYGVRVVEAATAAKLAKTLILVVKPQDMTELLGEIVGQVAPDALVVSLAAGITTDLIEQCLPGVAVARVMPNTPALVYQGMAAISAGRHCDERRLEKVTEIMSSVGRVVRVPETQQDAVTAISGSGPAYIFYVAEAMVEAGVLLGLPRVLATELTVQTVLGAATMLRETGEHPSLLREKVTSPAGTTAAALRELERHKVRAAFLEALEAARDRSRELAAGG